MSVDVAHVSVPKPGERENGDAVLVRRNDHGRAMLVVIDGLGHGPLAAAAAKAAVSCLEALPLETTALHAMQTVHAQLRDTRGAVATICLIDRHRMQCCAVGNVQLLAVNCVVPLVLSAGVLGRQVVKFRVCESELKAGARIALLSDGISARFRLEELRHLRPAEACTYVLERFRRNDDDATVLIADVGSVS